MLEAVLKIRRLFQGKGGRASSVRFGMRLFPARFRKYRIDQIARRSRRGPFADFVGGLGSCFWPGEWVSGEELGR